MEIGVDIAFMSYSSRNMNNISHKKTPITLLIGGIQWSFKKKQLK